MANSELASLIDHAFQRRVELVRQLEAESTDTYRLFHGVNEGRPGLTIDRYGTQVLVQTFYQPFDSDDQTVINRQISEGLGFEPRVVFQDRSPESRKQKQRSDSAQTDDPEESNLTSQEIGVRYVVKDGQKGQDPLLFLDLRAARRFVMTNCDGLSVLNLFAYSCGLGACAGVGGADEVWNIDFAKSILDIGQRNAELNGLPADKTRFIHSDYFPAIRQLAGLPVAGRGRKRNYKKLEPRQFDLVFLDPPRWAKSPFGTVDLIRDYQGVFKPALLTVSLGGLLICTNHVPQVNVNDWLEILRRCAAKAGRPVKDIEVIQPESDFPSPDGQHPLKIAVVQT